MGVLGGGELPLIAGSINVFLEWLKNRKHFREGSWTIPVMIIICVALAVVSAVAVPLVFSNGTFDIPKAIDTAITKASGLITLVHSNYKEALASGVGIFSPTKAENRSGA